MFARLVILVPGVKPNEKTSNELPHAHGGGMKHFVLAATLLTVGHTHRLKQPHIVTFTPKPTGATFTINNPLRKPIWFSFACADAFSAAWMEMPAHETATAEISSEEQINGPCTLRWKVKR